jgi:hypothetical protein
VARCTGWQTDQDRSFHGQRSWIPRRPHPFLPHGRVPARAARAVDAPGRLEGRIAALDSEGNTAHLGITPEIKVQGNVRLGKPRAKAQFGTRITVTRDSDAPDSTCTVRYASGGRASVTA